MSYHNLPNSSNLRTTNSQGQVAPPGYHYMPDGSLMLDSEMPQRGKVIKSFNLDLSDLTATSERRRFTIYGERGAEFTLEIKNEDNHYYNFVTNSFSATKEKLEGVIKSSVYNGTVKFPTVTDDDHYDVQLYAKPGTIHAAYNEVRFADGTLDINSSTGSNSLMLNKIIYQYTTLTLTLSNYSPNGTVALTNTSDTIEVFRGRKKIKTAFSISCSSASAASFRIIKQPTIDDILSFVSLTVGSAPELLRGENEFPAVTVTGKINGAVSSTTVTLDGLSGTPLVGDKFFITDAPNSVYPQIVEAVSVTEGAGNITSSVSVSISNDKGIQFSNRKNYQWPVDNILKIKPGMIVFGNANLAASTTVSLYEDSIVNFENTPQETVIIRNRSNALSTKSQKPTIVNGVVTVQPGNVVFNNQQLFALAGETIKIGGYGRKNILSVSGYDILFTDLAISLTPITTTTTSASSASTSVALTALDGIMNGVSTVSGIGIDPKVVDPTVNSGGNATGGGTVVLSAAQTLESGITLLFEGAGKVATITGSIEILEAGTENATLYFDAEKLLSTSA
jgi:hypothetical protein